MFICFNKKQTWLLQSEDCTERFCKDLKEQAIRIINYEKKEIIPLTNKDEKQNVCYISKNEFSADDNDGNKKYHKVRDHCHFTR